MDHEIRQCINPDCALRFKRRLPDDRAEPVARCRCPKCGSDTRPVETFSAQRVPGTKQDFNAEANHVELIGVLDNLRSALNVGSIFRTADAAGVKELRLLGITPTPLNPKVCKSSLGAETSVPWTHDWQTEDALMQLKQDGYEIWALEGGENAVNLFGEPSISPATHSLPNEAKRKIALVAGSEVSGIDPLILAKADKTVFLPMLGTKESLNVAIAFGIAAYVIKFGQTKHV